MVMRGLVTLLEANRPTVVCDSGEHYLCYLKGKIKRDVGRIMVGDRVVVEPTDPGEARIVEVLPRANHLVRPPVSNVSGIFVVFSLESPIGSRELLDKRLAIAHLVGLRVEIIVSKVDLLRDSDELTVLEEAYREAGYPVWRLSVTNRQGVEALVHESRDGIWVLSGESGVGKSSLLRAIIPSAEASTQELSRIGRGQQTTRWVRLYAIDNYWMADSPGYTALETRVTQGREIEQAFSEFSQFPCRFSDCLHGQEPGCGVIAGVESGAIAPWRYRNYRKILEEWVKDF